LNKALTRINTCRHLVVDSTASSINLGPEAAAQSDLEQIKEHRPTPARKQQRSHFDHHYAAILCAIRPCIASVSTHSTHRPKISAN
jgi:hypothetical protein